MVSAIFNEMVYKLSFSGITGGVIRSFETSTVSLPFALPFATKLQDNERSYEQ